MTYCIDFFRKFKKDGNFCGLDKSEVSRLNSYLEIVEQLMKQKIPEEEIYQNFSVRAARPLIEAKDAARTEGMNFVTKSLKAGKKVQTGDLQETLKSWTCPTSPPVARPVLEKKPEPAKSETSQKKTEFPDKVEPAEVCRPIPPDPAKPPQPSLGQQVREKEMQAAGQNQAHVHPGSKVTLNPVIINDTHRERPFQTAAQLKAHDADPLEVGKMFQEASTRDLQTVQPKTDKELFLEACETAYEHGKPDFRQAVDELMRYHPSWKDVGTVVYFCVTDPKEAIAGRR